MMIIVKKKTIETQNKPTDNVSKETDQPTLENILNSGKSREDLYQKL